MKEIKEENLISELTYISYATNRDLGMTAEQLHRIGFSLKYEIRYQHGQDNETKVVFIKPTIERN